MMKRTYISPAVTAVSIAPPALLDASVVTLNVSGVPSGDDESDTTDDQW